MDHHGASTEEGVLHQRLPGSCLWSDSRSLHERNLGRLQDETQFVPQTARFGRSLLNSQQQQQQRTPAARERATGPVPCCNSTPRCIPNHWQFVEHDKRSFSLHECSSIASGEERFSLLLHSGRVPL